MQQNGLILLCSSLLSWGVGWGFRLNLPHFLLDWTVPRSSLGVMSAPMWGAGLVHRGMNRGGMHPRVRAEWRLGCGETHGVGGVLAGPQGTQEAIAVRTSRNALGWHCHPSFREAVSNVAGVA